jgi:hypothetical protein
MSDPKARAGWITSLCIGLSSFALYCATLFPGVGGVLNHGDSAKFQFFGVVHAVGHPPGNPLYLALLYLVQSVPLGTPALRANVASAACAAATVALVASAAYRVHGLLAALVSALTLALGGLFWEFATEAEVYALAGLCVGFIVYSLARAESEHDPKFFAAALCAFALGVANHLSLVVAFPALVFAGVALFREGISLTRWGLFAFVGAGMCALGLYGLLPLIHHYSVYSEYPVSNDLAGFIQFVTGATWQQQFGIPSLEVALAERPLRVVSVLLRQYILPLWLCVPTAFYLLFLKAKATARFCAWAAIGWLVFLYLYDVPDPGGLAVPIAVTVAPAVGVAVASAQRPFLALTAVVAMLLPTVVLHLREVSDFVSYDVMEDVYGSPAREPLDFPDLIQRLPEDAYLTVPCGHYGCVQVTNYYRFADARTLARGIQIVTLHGSFRPPWPTATRIEPELAQKRVVCTVQRAERDLLLARGARMRTIARGSVQLREGAIERLPLFCSDP